MGARKAEKLSVLLNLSLISFGADLVGPHRECTHDLD